LLEQIRVWSPELVVLSGLMRLLPPNVVEALTPNIINTHPAYLPEFPGAHGVRDAIRAGVEQTGASIIVVDNGVDQGPIIVQERVSVLPGDTEHELHERIKPVERRLLVQTVLDIANGLDLGVLSTRRLPASIKE
jgi:phosphoribosylglycinamide formyltransferase-1